MIRFTLPVFFLLVASCAMPMGSSERKAQDRIMLVSNTPPTLGAQRLRQQSSTHRDLAIFLGNRGDPDFIAETSSEDRQYLILYYLKKEQAWACRSWRGQPNAIEFAGPYSITTKESEILEALQRNAIQSTRTGLSTGNLLLP